jgi:hypothetical protein
MTPQFGHLKRLELNVAETENCYVTRTEKKFGLSTREYTTDTLLTGPQTFSTEGLRILQWIYSCCFYSFPLPFAIPTFFYTNL